MLRSVFLSVIPIGDAPLHKDNYIICLERA